MKKPGSHAKERREARERILDAELKRLFGDQSRALDDRAAEAISLLDWKLESDIDDQREAVRAAAESNASQARVQSDLKELIGLLTKRQDVFDRLKTALAVPKKEKNDDLPS